MSCCDDDPCADSSTAPRKTSKMLCPCQKCKEERGERKSFQIAAKAASSAGNLARLGGNCLGKLTSMLQRGMSCEQEPATQERCDDEPKDDCQEERRPTRKPCCCQNPEVKEPKPKPCCCKPPQVEKKSKGCCCSDKSESRGRAAASQCDDESEGSFDCDDDRAACLCAATPDAATSISCFICECVATLGVKLFAVICLLSGLVALNPHWMQTLLEAVLINKVDLSHEVPAKFEALPDGPAIYRRYKLYSIPMDMKALPAWMTQLKDYLFP